MKLMRTIFPVVFVLARDDLRAESRLQPGEKCLLYPGIEREARDETR